MPLYAPMRELVITCPECWRPVAALARRRIAATGEVECDALGELACDRCGPLRAPDPVEIVRANERRKRRIPAERALDVR